MGFRQQIPPAFPMTFIHQEVLSHRSASEARLGEASSSFQDAEARDSGKGPEEESCRFGIDKI
jgi:hypothetical protein